MQNVNIRLVDVSDAASQGRPGKNFQSAQLTDIVLMGNSQSQTVRLECVGVRIDKSVITQAIFVKAACMVIIRLVLFSMSECSNGF